ncbi:hypothetical protein QFZ41_001006 [Luteibacter sp. W1I16]|uniref:hypothetical protein n=1 Tax=Luteibacter sp. W1I16 TaxID=3373922 RepID=UPI003D2608F4
MESFARNVMATLIAVGACPMASAMTRDRTSVDGVLLLTLGDEEDVAEVRRLLGEWLDDGTRIALTGPAPVLEHVRPDSVYAWPSSNTIVLDPGAGLGIFGVDAHDTDHRLAILMNWTWVEADITEPTARVRRVVDNSLRKLDVAFDFSAASPSAACRTVRRKMASVLFDGRLVSRDEQRAFASEMRRWCQYGDLSVHVAAPPQFTIQPFRGTDEPLLTLVTEWALLRNEDPVQPATTSYLFWVKTVSEGGGSGFGRRDGTEAYFDASGGGLHRLLDASIHSGWGPVAHDELLTAWPLNSTFPSTGNTHVFVCDGPGEAGLPSCPRKLRLRTLRPADSTDGVVTVSLAERFIVGGNAQAGISADTAGKITPSINFSLNLVRERMDAGQSEMRLVQTRSNTDTVFYRTTRWTPDVPAIYSWINARAHLGSLVQATPLASTLNPLYEILWELPLQDNAGRKLPYHVIYEAGWNTCFNGPNCANHLRPPDPSLSAKARVAWKDRLALMIPYD